MTAAEMVEQLNGLAGLDIEDDEALVLLNEGYVEMCSDAEWFRAVYTASTAVNDADYDLPADLYRILSVHKNGVPQVEISLDDVAQIQAGNSYLVYENYGQSVYSLEGDSDGTDHLALYPTPQSSDPLTIIYVKRPDDLTEDDEPLIPREFHRGIIHYAAYLAYSMLEDDEGAAEIQYGRYTRYAEKLRNLRYSKGGRGVKRLQLQGWNFN